jgi:hypothetical protein
MNPVIRDRWVAALRSGEYVQGRELLHYDAGVNGTAPRFCCLGVLCDLAYRDGVVARVITGSAGTYATYGYHDEDDPDEDVESSVLPGSVARWAGLRVRDDDHEDGEVVFISPRANGVELTVWNDGEQPTFPDGSSRAAEDFTTIARLIEEYL